jgi:hypothetical protein
MKPTDKNKVIEEYLEVATGRTTAILNNKCIPPPYGCGKDANDFRNALSIREYRISGFCQECQDTIFGID